MKKVTAFVGSGHKRLTHSAVRQFLDDQIDSAISYLNDLETEGPLAPGDPLLRARDQLTAFRQAHPRTGQAEPTARAETRR